MAESNHILSKHSRKFESIIEEISEVTTKQQICIKSNKSVEETIATEVSKK